MRRCCSASMASPATAAISMCLATALSQHYRVVCPDMPGRGKSEWLNEAADYGYPVYLGDITALIARLDVERVDWVGTSMGGIIGMLFAALPDTPIRKLVINDIGARRSESRARAHRRLCRPRSGLSPISPRSKRRCAASTRRSVRSAMRNGAISRPTQRGANPTAASASTTIRRSPTRFKQARDRRRRSLGELGRDQLPGAGAARRAIRHPAPATTPLPR